MPQWAQRELEGWGTGKKGRCRKGGSCTRGEAERAAAKHGSGDTVHNGLCLDMKVPVHLIGAPAPDETYAVAVNACTKESHGTARAGGTCRHIFCSKTQIGGQSNRTAKESGDLARLNILPSIGRRCPRSVQRGGGRGGVKAQMGGPGRETKDRAEDGVTGAAVADGLPADAILLRREGQGGEGRGKQIRKRTREDVQAAVTNPEPQVLEPEQIIRRVFGCARVLAWTQEKIESDDHAVGRSTSDRRGGEMRKMESAVHELQRKGFDAGGGRVGLLPRLEQSREADIHGAEGIQARVDGPHPDERLPHASYGVLHRARSDGPAAGGQLSEPVAVGEELEYRYLVRWGIGEVGKDSKIGTKGRPESMGGLS